MGYTLDDVRQAKRMFVKDYMGVVARPGFMTQFVSSDPEHNVVGVGVKSVGGHAVQVYVAKLPPDEIPEKWRLPSNIDGIPVDVVESGRFMAYATDRLRPAQPGCSIGFKAKGAARMAGTLGAIVARRKDIFLLSNNHVLAGENELKPGTEIVQPGCLDEAEAETIASLSEFIPLDTAEPNAVDCAIAAVLNRNAVDPVFLPEVNRLASADPVVPAENMLVVKVGRSTDSTAGRIVDADADLNVRYDRIGTIRLEGQVLIRGTKGQFSTEGDSGAVIVDQVSRRGVALLCAGTVSLTVGSPLNEVLSRMNVTLVTQW